MPDRPQPQPAPAADQPDDLGHGGIVLLPLALLRELADRLIVGPAGYWRWQRTTRHEPPEEPD